MAKSSSTDAGRAGTSITGAARVSDLLRLADGPLDLSALDPRKTPGAPADKADAKKALELLGPRLADLQERLYAQGRSGGQRSVLLVLQGMDTAGKGGTIRHVVGQVDPQGVFITAFKAPTREELAHDFLWRIKARLPGPGMLGVFDRSHYEDVVVTRVRGTIDRRTWRRRYDTINRFEAGLVQRGTTVIKCFLHVSSAEARDRLLTRLETADKRWKYNPGDVDSLAERPELLEAYSEALERCNTDVAPWYVVPADRKWYRNWAIMHILIEQLEALQLTWPPSEVDVKEERRRIRALE